MDINTPQFEAMIKANITAKITDIVHKECNSYGIINTDIEVKRLGDYFFAVAHTELQSSSSMHRYNMFCFSTYGIQIHYQDGNAIDKSKKHSIEETIQCVKNYFTFHAAKINSLSFS